MKLFEYESKAIFRKYEIETPRGNTAESAEEAAAITRSLGKPVFLKAQILVSGRGKAGGILRAANDREAFDVAGTLLCKNIKDSLVKTLLVEEKLDLAQQFFASVAIDRQAKAYKMLMSVHGGVDIEETAKAHPENIARLRIDPIAGLNENEVYQTVKTLNLPTQETAVFSGIMMTLYRIAQDCDAEMVEINPLGLTTDGKFIAVDARIIIYDDNALFRHPEFNLRSQHRGEDTLREAEARRQGFSYVDLDGDIGIIGNGAGLVMATVDLVYLFGGKPANFLDIGGGARQEVIKKALLLVMSKPEVKDILINILGGITRCDIVARGVVDALRASPVRKTIVVRMVGTNEMEGQAILAEHGITTYSDMEPAAMAILNHGRLN